MILIINRFSNELLGEL